MPPRPSRVATGKWTPSPLCWREPAAAGLLGQRGSLDRTWASPSAAWRSAAASEAPHAYKPAFARALPESAES
eukprot:scaffold119406_cov48-Phaeocystis_antarctica.AAC.1